MRTTSDIQLMKQNNEPIAMVTAYDYPSAKMAEKANVDMILVGDSLGMVTLGYESTIEVTLDDMLHHAKAVKRGAKNTFIVVDMPFMTYHSSIVKALENAQYLFQNSNAHALKLEGASEDTLKIIRKLTEAGIPVVAHLGLTPQSVNVLGGYKLQGKTESEKARIEKEAKLVTEAGAIAIVIEMLPQDFAKEITESVSIPTIGIGSGLHCDGQVIVYHDLLNYEVDHTPSFAKKYADLSEIGLKGLETYVEEVKMKTFPCEKYSFK